MNEEAESLIEKLRWEWATIDAYKPPKDEQNWKACPKCQRKPRVWEFDNGSYARCQCKEKYTGADVSVQSICDYGRQNNWNFTNYDIDGLRKAWNSHVEKSENNL